MTIIVPDEGFEGPDSPDVQVSPDARGGIYLVQPGDTLGLIAQAVYGDPTQFGLIAEANGLTGSNVLLVGQELIIPAFGGVVPVIPTPGPEPTVPVGSRMDEAIQDQIALAALSSWTPRPSFQDSDDWEDVNGQPFLRFTTPSLPEGFSAEDALARQLDSGAQRIELPGGEFATYQLTPDDSDGRQWRMSIALPDGQLLSVAMTGNDLERAVPAELNGWLAAIQFNMAQASD